MPVASPVLPGVPGGAVDTFDQNGIAAKAVSPYCDRGFDQARGRRPVILVLAGALLSSLRIPTARSGLPRHVVLLRVLAVSGMVTRCHQDIASIENLSLAGP